MAQIVDTETVSDLVINKVPSQAVYDDMVAHGQIEEDELYLVEGDVERFSQEYSIAATSGVKSFTIQSNSRMIMVCVKNANVDGTAMYIVTCTTSGVVNNYAIKAFGTGVTITKSTNTLTISNESSATEFVTFIMLYGNQPTEITS